MGAKDKVKNIAKNAGKKVLSSIAINLVPILLPIILIFLVVASIFTSFMEVSADIEKQEGTSFTVGIYGGSVQEKVWWALKECGFSDEQVAAAMGNIECESAGFVPDRVEFGYNENNGGIGLCQWTNNNRGDTGNNTNLKAFAASKHSTWQDEDVQVKFLVTYLTGTGEATEFTGKSNMGRSYFGNYYPPTSWEDYKSTGNVDNDIDYLTRAFLANYEGPSEMGANSSIAGRIAAAKKYYNEFHGKSKPTNDNVTLGSGEDITINNNNYTILKNAKKAYQIIQDRGFYQASNDAWGDHCLGFSYVFTHAIYTGDMTNLKNANHDGNNDPTGYFGVGSQVISSNKDTLVKQMFSLLKSGKPCCLQVVGSTNGSPSSPRTRHYVSLVGYKKGATESTVKDTDLLILDTWDGELKPVVEEYTEGRYMLDGAKVGWDYHYQYFKMLK